MNFRRRALPLSGLGLVLAGVVLVACSDGGSPVGPPEPETPAVPDTARLALHCEVDLASRGMSCGKPSGTSGARGLIIGGQNVNVTLAASNFSTTNVPDAAEMDTLAMDVTVTNLIGQALGVLPDGNPDVANGVRVFFFTGPTAFPSGTAEVAGDFGTDVFLGATQPFYRYPQVIQPTETSAATRWKLAHSDGATSVRFTVYVDAQVRFPDGWVDVTPAADTLATGELSTLAGVARDALGRTAGISQTLTWSTADSAVATVGAGSGVVTAVAQGTTTISVTNGTQQGTATIVVNNAPMAVADTIDALGNVTVPVDSAQGLLVNDTDANGDGLRVVTGTFPTARGGSVTFAANGSLQYAGPAGFELGLDSVQYTVSDGVQQASAFLHINVGERVWYVQPGAAAPGNGTQAAPFDALVGVDSITSANETVYLLGGGATPVADAGITLKAGQSLVGQALASPVVTVLNDRTVVLLPTGDAPLLRRTTAGNTIRLGTNNTISGLRVGSSAGAAISGVGFGTLSLDSVSVAAVGGPALDLETGTLSVALDSLASSGSATHGVRLVGTSGTLSAAGGAVEGTFTVTGGSVAVTYPGSLSETDAALVSVSGAHTGTLVFSGALAATGGTGLQFSDADGVYTFSGTAALGGGDAGIDVLGSAGTFTFGTGVGITNPTGTALAVSGDAPTVSFAGTISANAGRPVSVDALTGGSVVVSGTVAGTGLGILVGNNTAGAVSFTGSSKTLSTGANPALVLANNGSASVLFSGGGLAITTTTGAGLAASTGGTVEITGVGNTITTGTGTPVTINGTAIAGSGVTFARVSANGAANGIVLNNTGSVNGLQVTGDGTNAAGSGGVIRKTTGAAVSLNGTLQTSFAYLDLDSVAGGFVGSNFGALSVNNVVVSSVGAPALGLATGSVTGNFSGISASGAANGVSLTGVGGFFAANGGTIVGGAGAAFLVSGGDAGVVWNGSIAQNGPAPLVSIGGGHNVGTITFQTGTLQAADGRGLVFDNADGTYAFNGTTTLNGGTAGVDILNGSAGSFTFGTGTSITSAASDTAFFVGASNPGVTFSGSISKATAGPLLQMTNVSGGTVTFQTGTLSATGGTGLQFSNADGAVNFNGTTTLNGGDAGIDILAGSDGNFAFGTGVGITSPTGTAFLVNGSSPTVTMRGPITKANAGLAVDVTNMAAGNITFGLGLAGGGATPVLSATAGEGILLSNVDGTVNFTGTTTLAGGNAAVDVVGGSDGVIYFAPTSSITNPTGIALDVNSGTPALVFRGSIAQNAGRAVSVQNVSADSVVVSGTISNGTSVAPAGTGILVQNNSGGTFAFDGSAKTFFTASNAAVTLANNSGATMRFGGGGLAITTTSGNGFSATGGGTVQVTGAANTISSTGGVALNVQNTSIGTSGLSFQSISANGGTNGIALNNTGATNGLQVTGTGVANSGGTIQNTSGAGIALVSTTNPKFNYVRIVNTTRSGVEGTQVTHFEFTNGSIDQSGDAPGIFGADESNISFFDQPNPSAVNITGVVTITNNSLSNAYHHGIRMRNGGSGTISQLTISDNVITTPTTDAASVGSGILIDMQGAGINVTRATINNNDIFNVPTGAGILMVCGNSSTSGLPTNCGTPGSGTDVINITNNQIWGQSAANRIGSEGLVANMNGRGQGNFNVSGNDIRNTDGRGMGVSAFGQVRMHSTVANNLIISTPLFDGTNMEIGADSTSGMASFASYTATVTGNNVSGHTGPGIFAIARGSSDSLRVKLLNNTVSRPNATAFRGGIQVFSGSAEGNTWVCARVEGNTTEGSTSGGGTKSGGILFRKQGTVSNVNTFGIHGLPSSPANSFVMESHWTAQNPASILGSNGFGATRQSGGDFVSCNLP